MICEEHSISLDKVVIQRCSASKLVCIGTSIRHLPDVLYSEIGLFEEESRNRKFCIVGRSVFISAYSYNICPDILTKSYKRLRDVSSLARAS